MTIILILIMTLALLHATLLARINLGHSYPHQRIKAFIFTAVYLTGLFLSYSFPLIDIIKPNYITSLILLFGGLVFMVSLPGIGWIEMVVWVLALLNRPYADSIFFSSLVLWFLFLTLRVKLIYSEKALYLHFFLQRKGSLFKRDTQLGIGADLARSLMVLITSTAFFYSLRVLTMLVYSESLPWYSFSWSALSFVILGFISNNHHHKTGKEAIAIYVDVVLTLLTLPFNFLTTNLSSGALLLTRYSRWTKLDSNSSLLFSSLRIIIPGLLMPLVIASIVLLFNDQNITLFNQNTSLLNIEHQEYFIISMILLAILGSTSSFLIYRWKKSLKNEYARQLLTRANDYEQRLAVIYQQLSDQKLEKGRLEEDLRLRNDQLMNMALVIIQKNDFITEMREKIKATRTRSENNQVREELQKVIIMLTEAISMDKERESFYLMVDEHLRDFFIRLQQKFPDLTQNERRLVAFLRLRLSSKEIASLLNITPRSVEMNRYRLRKKLGITPSGSITEFISSL